MAKRKSKKKAKGYLLPKYQMQGRVLEAGSDSYLAKESRKARTKLKTYENEVNNLLEDPKRTREDITNGPNRGVNNVNEDALRHGITGYRTAKAIKDRFPNWVPDILSSAGGSVGATLLGLGHEMASPKQSDTFEDFYNFTLEEAKQDAMNNYYGSRHVGSDPEVARRNITNDINSGKYYEGRAEKPQPDKTEEEAWKQARGRTEIFLDATLPPENAIASPFQNGGVPKYQNGTEHIKEYSNIEDYTSALTARNDSLQLYNEGLHNQFSEKDNRGYSYKTSNNFIPFEDTPLLEGKDRFERNDKRLDSTEPREVVNSRGEHSIRPGHTIVDKNEAFPEEIKPTKFEINPRGISGIGGDQYSAVYKKPEVTPRFVYSPKSDSQFKYTRNWNTSEEGKPQGQVYHNDTWVDYYQNGGLPKYQTEGDVTPNKNASPLAYTDGYVSPEENQQEIERRKRAENTYNLIPPTSYMSISNYRKALDLGKGNAPKRENFIDPRSEEAYKQYLGINYRPEHLTLSETRPSIAENPHSTYYKFDPELESHILRFAENLPYGTIPLNKMLNFGEGDFLGEFGSSIEDEDTPYNYFSALGNFQIGRGIDSETGEEYYSYSDRYDFPDTIQEGLSMPDRYGGKKLVEGLEGTPFEIYNRIPIPKKSEDFLLYIKEQKEAAAKSKKEYSKWQEENKRQNGGRIRKYQNDGRVYPYWEDRKEGNVNDWLITKQELIDYQKDYSRMTQKCRTGGCLERASMYYDQNISGLLETPAYNTIKENSDISASNPKAKDYRGPHDRFEEYEHSADSWDIHGLLQEKGAKQVYAHPLESNSKIAQSWRKFRKKPIEEQEQYWRDLNIPLGSIVGMGYSGGVGTRGTKSYNKEKGLVPNNHSGMVAGYDKTGLPYIYDWDKIVPITETRYEHYPITNITAPKEIQQNTFAYLSNREELEDAYTPLKLNISDKETNSDYDPDELDPFIEALEGYKKEISNALGIDFALYDELAKRAVATALSETEGGNNNIWRFGEGAGPLGIAPSYITDKMGIGNTTGITQINEDLIWGRVGTEEQRKGNRMPAKLNALNIREEDYDPWHPTHQAKATIAFLYDNLEVGRKNLKKGVNKETGSRNSLDLPDEQVGYYQWFQPNLMNDGVAWGESEKVKKFAESYAKVSTGDLEETPVELSPPASDSRQYGGNVEQDPLYASLLNAFQNGGEVESYQGGTEVVIPNSENEEVVPMQQELPHQEIVSFPTEREPAGDPRVPRSSSVQDYYTNLENTPVPKTLSKKYKIWESSYKSPMGLSVESYKNIYDIQAFFNSGDWKENFESIEKYRKSSHPMLGTTDPKTNTFVPSEDNLNTNEEIASHIDINDIPVNFKKVERIPINPDGFAPGSATEFADKVVIPSGSITMKDMQEPILANGEMLMPGDEAQFDTDYVVEEKLPKAQNGLRTHIDSVEHQVNKILQYEQLQGGPGGRPLPSYSDPRYKSMLMDDIYPEINKIMPNSSAIEKGEAMDYVFNAGWDKSNKKIKRDPRSYALQEYYRKYYPSNLDKDGKWAGRKGAPYTFDAEYARTIGKLPENERRVLMNKGRDWYYQNINTKPDGSPSDNYASTWYGRVHNTNDFSEFNPNNPKFKRSEKKQYGGKLKAQDGLKVEGKKLSKKEVDDVRNFVEDDTNFVQEYPYLLDEAVVEDKLDRTNPTAVRNWSREHDPIAYAAREATDEAAPYVATGLGMAFAPAAGSLLGAGARGLAATGEAAYGALSPYASAAWNTNIPGALGMSSVPGATVGNLINAGFGTHGATNIAPDALELLTNPLSLENLANVGIDALEMAPMYGPMSKMLGELETIGRVGKSSKPTSAKVLMKEYDAIESKISRLKEQEALYNTNQKKLLQDYKNKRISGEEYKKQIKEIQPWPHFENPIHTLEKQLRELKVKQDIFNTPQKNILKSENQLGKNISDGGTNNKGVFEIGYNYVARQSAHGYDDASRLVNYSGKLKSPRIMKTHQVKELNGKVFQIQDKATGVPYTQLSEAQLKNLPKNHIDNFYKDIAELEKNGLRIDISGRKSNIFYDPKKGFQFIDLGIGKMPSTEIISKTVKLPNKSSKPASAAAPVTSSNASTPALRMNDTELTAYFQHLEKQGVNLDNVKHIAESERFTINGLAKAHPDNKVNHILKAEDFLTDLSGSTKLIQSKIDNKVKLLESAEGYKRQLNIEKDYLREIGVPKEEIRRLAPLNVDARIEELKGLKIGNKEIEEMHKAGTYFDPTSSSMFSAEAEKLFLKENLYNNAYYNRPSHVELLDPYTPIKTSPENSSFINQAIEAGAFNLKKDGSGQLGREAVHGGSINFSKLFKNEGATIDHEIAHAFQRGRVLPLDDALREGITLRKNLNANQQNAAEYFKLGSQGKESSAFLAEVKTSMIEAGLLENEHSRVTPTLVKRAQLFFEKNPRWILAKNKSKATSRYYSQHRLLDFMEASKSNFQLVADKLNQTNVLIPGIGITAAGSAGSKD